MRPELLVPKAIRRLRPAPGGRQAWTAGALVLALVSGCAKVPLVGGKPALELKVTATADCNSCGKPNGYPIYIRLLQVTDPSAMTGVSLAQLWDREDKVLAAALVAKSEQVIDPGTSKEFKIEKDDKAKSVIIVGNFCKSDGNCWYLIKPLKGGGLKLKLTADASCLRETKK